MEYIQNVILSNEEDRWVWEIGVNGYFTVGKIMRWIDDAILHSSGMEII